MEIVKSNTDDLHVIFEMYDAAVAFQKAKSNLFWLPFDRQMVVAEIAEGRQWKITMDGAVACVFATAYSDPAIWGERDSDPSIYLHRIVTNPSFRGKNFVLDIIEWAKNHGKEMGKKFIRLDTWAESLPLKEYYQKCGFQFVGITTPQNRGQLPAHYSGISLGLFEISID